MSSHKVDELYVEIGLDTKEYDKSAKKLEKSFDGTKKKAVSVEESFSSIGSGAASAAKGSRALASGVVAVGVAAVGAISGLIALGTKIASANASTGDFSANIGVSATELKKWSYAVEMAGGNADSAKNSLAAMSKAMNDLQMKGDSSMLPFFNAIGVSMLDADGKARKLNDVMLDLSDAFSKMDRQQAYQIAQGMGIDDGTFNMLVRGRSEAERLLKESESAAETSEKDIEESKKLVENKAKLNIQLERMATTLGNSIIPALTTFAEIINSFLGKKNDTLSKATGGIRNATSKAANWVKEKVSSTSPSASAIPARTTNGQYGNRRTTGLKNGKLILSQQDIDDILRVSATEVTPLKNQSEYQKQVGGVVDTILNRAAYQGSVRGAINQKWAFSAINNPAGLKGGGRVYGTVQNVPMSRVSPRLRASVLAHLRARNAGMESTIGGNTHYANPNFLGQASAATKRWVRQAEQQSAATGYKFGTGNAYHVHGTPIGEAKLPKFGISIPSLSHSTPPSSVAGGNVVNINSVNVSTSSSTMSGTGNDMGRALSSSIAQHSRSIR